MPAVAREREHGVGFPGVGERRGQRVRAGELEAQVEPAVGAEGRAAVQQDRGGHVAIAVVQRAVDVALHGVACGLRGRFVHERIDVEIGAILEARAPHARRALPEPTQQLRRRPQRLAFPHLHVSFEDADVAAPIATREAIPFVVGDAHAAVGARFRIALFGPIRRRHVPTASAVAATDGDRETGPSRLALAQRVGHAPEGAEIVAQGAPGRLVERQEPQQLRNDQLCPAASPRPLQRGFDQPSSVGCELVRGLERRQECAEVALRAPESSRWPRPSPLPPRPGTKPPAPAVAGRREAAPRAPPSWDTTATPGRTSQGARPRRAQARRQAEETEHTPACNPSR